MLHFQVKLLTGLLFWLWFIQAFKSHRSLCIFCLCHPRHINLTTSAFTDKGSYSYNSGKSPLHLQAVLLYGVFSCPLQWCILMPWFSTPFFHEVCMFLLPYMGLIVESWCKFDSTSLKSTQGIRYVQAPGKQRFRTQWSLPLCVFTCESHNPSLQPTTILVMI